VFDAGAIEARLTLRTDTFDRDLKLEEARVDDFTRKKHEVRISAVFDHASISKARMMFAQLDQAISRDAASRLRSSPDGSVLGTLNSLFSPHSVTGAPSASQSAQQGLLGKMISGTGGGIGQTVTDKDTVKNVIGVDDVSARAAGARAGKEAADAADDAARTESGKKGKSGGWLTGLMGGLLGGLFSGGGRGGGGAGGDVAAAASGGGMHAFGALTAHLGPLTAGIAGGIGPGILGIGLKMTAIIGAVGTALAALPALAGLIGGGLGVALIGGAIAGVVATSPKLKAQFSAIGGDAKNVLTAAGKTIVPALSAVLKQVPALLKTLQAPLAGVFKVVAPQLMGLFKGIVPIITGLVKVMQAAAPAFGPLIGGLEKLVANLFPGLIMVVKAFVPVAGQFGAIMGQLGSNLGGLFGAAGPAMKASMQVIGDLLGVVGGLLPLLSKLGGVFASALAPVFSQLGAVIRSLMPFLQLLGGVLASLVQAIIGDLVSAFGSLAQLLQSVAPALTTFAQALSAIFNVLENTGTFAILGDALEDIVGPLGKLIDAVVRGLIPVLGPVISLVGVLSAEIASGLGMAIAAVLPPVTKLATVALAALAQLLPVIVPVLSDLTKILSAAFVVVVTALATALSAVISAIPVPVLKGIVDAVLAIWGAVKLWTIAQALLNIALDANPIGLVLLAVAALAVGIVELYEHWNTVWTWIRKIAEDAWNFIYNGWGKYLLPLLGPEGMLALGAMELYQHWNAIWGDIQDVLNDFYNWVWTDFGQKIGTFLTRTLPGWFDTAKSDILGVFDNAMNWLYNGGQNIITGLWNGIRNIWNDVIHFFEKLPADIMNALGIHSPPQWAIEAGQHIMNGIGIGMGRANTVASAAREAVANAKANFGLPGQPASGSPAQAQQLAMKMAALIGWTGNLWSALNNVAMAESGWSMTARNPGSGAYGIAQFINGPSEYAQYGGNATTMTGQLIAFFNYIKQRYGNPAAAWAHEQVDHWYGSGGLITEPVVGYGMNTGQVYALAERGPEWVTPAGAKMPGLGASGMASAQLADTINLMMPEGSTLAQAFTELTWQLNVARMNQTIPGVAGNG